MAEKKTRKARKHIELSVKIKAIDKIKRGKVGVPNMEDLSFAGH